MTKSKNKIIKPIAYIDSKIIFPQKGTIGAILMKDSLPWTMGIYTENQVAILLEQKKCNNEQHVIVDMPTTYIQRFGDALQALCKGVRPSDKMMDDWLTHKSEELQSFCCNNGIYWAQGIGIIDAALVLVDNPTEGEDHEPLP